MRKEAQRGWVTADHTIQLASSSRAGYEPRECGSRARNLNHYAIPLQTGSVNTRESYGEQGSQLEKCTGFSWTLSRLIREYKLWDGPYLRRMSKPGMWTGCTYALPAVCSRVVSVALRKPSLRVCGSHNDSLWGKGWKIRERKSGIPRLWAPK